MERILAKKNLQRFFDDLNLNRDVIGPKKKGGGTATYSHTTFGKIDKIEDLDINYKSSMLSPKKILFPDNQPLYKYKKNKQKIALENLRSAIKQDIVLFGIHTCDIAAIGCLDKVFGEEGFMDSYYSKRRTKTIVIGLTCEEPQVYCFCQAVGSGPDIEAGFDLLMTDLGDRYFLKSGTKRGETLLASDYFSEVMDGDYNKREQKLESARKNLSEPGSLTEVATAMGAKFNDEMWNKIAEECCSCGSCNMVCPTCHCFTIADKTNVDFSTGKRILIWDACHFERFATMAGNFNIRESKESRYKHRLYDKFYYDPQRYGTVFCVGCGRCIQFCPAHIDIIAALKALQEE